MTTIMEKMEDAIDDFRFSTDQWTNVSLVEFTNQIMFTAGFKTL